MKNKSILTPEEIETAFQQNKETALKTFKDSKIDTALMTLSEAVADLQNAGINVRLSVHGATSENATELARTVKFSRDIGVALSGMIQIDNQNHLFSLVTFSNRQSGLWLYLSKHDISQQGVKAHMMESTTYTSKKIRARIAGDVYDMESDPEAILKLQKEIIRKAARNEVIRDLDIQKSFDHGKEQPVRRLNKPTRQP